jgi:hypothetical protein
MDDRNKTFRDLNPSTSVSNIVNPSASKPKLKFPIIIAIIIGTIILLVNVSFGYYLYKQQSLKQIACTMEAKICPDGTSVGRSGPKCEFAPCPVVQKPTPTEANQNQATCTSDADCKKGLKCITVGPIVANQPVKKVCSQEGVVSPL